MKIKHYKGYSGFFVSLKNGEVAPIESDNVLARCPQCGKLHSIDLCELLKTDFDLYGSRICCEACSELTP